MRQIRKAREAVENPKEFSEIVLNKDEKKHLLHMDEEMMLFGDKQMFVLLMETSMLFIDGTFRVVPKPLFYQMYSIHVLTCGIVVPVIYGLLTSKKNSLYKKFFEKCEECTKLKFLHRSVIILGDFEICFMSFFDESVLKKVCIFHFCQTLW